MNAINHRIGLSSALRVSSDMPAIWREVDLHFDQAASLLVDAHQRDGAARDQPVMDLRTWALTPTDGYFSLEPLAKQHAPVRLRATAFSHLCAKLGAPVEFVRDKLNAAQLQLAVMNFLLASYERPLSSQLRLRGNDCTAIVSERFAALDAEQFVESVRAALLQQGLLGEVCVKALATGTTDAIRLILPGENRELKVGDTTAVGLTLTNSSFGKSALRIVGSLWRLVCTNGLAVPSSIGAITSLRHVGDSQRLRDGLRDAIPTALLHARGFMDQWQQAVGTYVEQVGDLIDSLRELTLGERERVTDELKKEVQASELPEFTSAYDLVNSMTAAAKDAEPARRLELESFAGSFLQRTVGAS